MNSKMYWYNNIQRLYIFLEIKMFFMGLIHEVSQEMRFPLWCLEAGDGADNGWSSLAMENSISISRDRWSL